MISISVPRRRGRGVLLVGALICGIVCSSIAPAIAAEGAVGGLSGLVLDPSGSPAEGFRLVFRDDAGEEYTSAPSDDLGRYSIDVPAGYDYQLVAALAPDGSRTEVPALPALPVAEGVRRLDVKIGQAAPAPEPESQPESALPWVEIGVATAAVIVMWLAVWDSDDKTREKPASPFVPGT